MKYYLIRKVKKNKGPNKVPVTPAVSLPEKSIKRTVPFTALESGSGESPVWMNEAQVKAVKRASAGERFVMWFYRWSQVMFWVGIALVLCDMALIISDAIIDLFQFSAWQNTLIGIAGAVGAVMLAFGEYIDRKIQYIDERGKKQKKRSTVEQLPSISTEQ